MITVVTVVLKAIKGKDFEKKVCFLHIRAQDDYSAHRKRRGHEKERREPEYEQRRQGSKFT